MITYNEFTSEIEYHQFNEAVDLYLNGTMNEGLIPASLKKKFEFVKDLAAKMKTDFKSLLSLFKQKPVFTFFKMIKWSFKKLFSILKKGFKAYQDVIKAITEYIADTVVGKWTEKELRKLDKFLQEHPILKKMGGLVVGGILIYIWFNMSFSGDLGYDFGMDDLFGALAGKFTLATLFAGSEGAKLLGLLVVGLVGASFPWPGPSSAQFIIGVVGTLAAKVKHKLKST